MRRFVFSFPFSIATFLIGVFLFAVVNAVSHRTMLLDLPPPMISEDPPPLHIPYPSGCDGETTDDEMTMQVYSLVLDLHRYKGSPVVIDEFTTRGGTIIDELITGRNVKGVGHSTIEDYRLKNLEPRSLRELPLDRDGVVFLSEKDGEAISRNAHVPFEEKLRKRFPGARRLVSLSSVGFDPHRTEALVYVSYYCGSLCAGGSFYVLRRSGIRWIVDD